MKNNFNKCALLEWIVLVISNSWPSASSLRKLAQLDMKFNHNVAKNYFVQRTIIRQLTQWKMDGNERNLNCFYSIFVKNSHGHFKCIKNHKQQLLGIILWFFMHLKWPWLLRFFEKMLLKQFKFILFPSIFHCARS